MLAGEVRAVVFDVGETLVDEAPFRHAWAKALGVDHTALERALEDGIRMGLDHREAVVRVRADLSSMEVLEAAPPWWDTVEAYPDAAPAIERLRAAGYVVGVAGNQTDAPSSSLRRLGLEVHLAVSAGDLGAEKPSPRFFDALADRLGLPAREVAYVGDRVDFDVLPALEAGMTAVFVRRGPWGRVHASWPEASRADATIDSLLELPDALDSAGLRGEARPPRTP